VEVQVIIGFIIGFIASLASVIIYERGKRPYLTIGLGSTVDDQKPGITPYRFTHIAVENKRVCWLLRRITDRSAAYACQALIEVYFQGTRNRAIQQDIRARWSGTPELVQTVAIPTPAGTLTAHVPDVTKLPQGRRMDIFASYTEEFDISLKFEGDPDCYIFSNESYLVPNPAANRPWRNPNWRLNVGDYDIVVKVLSGSITKEEHFALENRGARREDMILRPL